MRTFKESYYFTDSLPYFVILYQFVISDFIDYVTV